MKMFVNCVNKMHTHSCQKQQGQRPKKRRNLLKLWSNFSKKMKIKAVSRKISYKMSRLKIYSNQN
jgi:hypothetical protein